MTEGTINIGKEELQKLKEDYSLIFGFEVPELVLMPYAKYARLVAEGDPKKIKKRLKIEKNE